MTDDGPDEVVITEEAEAGMAKLLANTGLGEEEFRTLLMENVELGKPSLQPPIATDDIEDIEDARRRALAWDLHAIACAYNYASDPTLPDLARDDVGTWIGPAVEARLEAASALLMDAYTLLLDDMEADTGLP